MGKKKGQKNRFKPLDEATSLSIQQQSTQSKNESTLETESEWKTVHSSSRGQRTAHQTEMSQLQGEASKNQHTKFAKGTQPSSSKSGSSIDSAPVVSSPPFEQRSQNASRQREPQNPNPQGVSPRRGPNPQQQPQKYSKNVKQTPQHSQRRTPPSNQQPSTSQSKDNSKQAPQKKDDPFSASDEGKSGNTLVQYTTPIPGKAGTKFPLEVNHMRIKMGKIKTVHVYDVSFEPDKPKYMLRKVWEQFQKTHYPNRKFAFDGRKFLISAVQLSDNAVLMDEITCQDDNNRDMQFKMSMQYNRPVDLSALERIAEHFEPPRAAIQCLNIILRMAPSRSLIQSGSSFFSRPPNGPVRLGGGMEMHSGIYQSVVPGTQLLLNVDLAHKPFPEPLNVIDALMDVCRLKPDQLSRGLSDFQWRNLNDYMKGLKVIFGLKQIKRVVRVNELAESADRNIITYDDGTKASLAEHFWNKEEFRYRIKYPNLPTLFVGNPNGKFKVCYPLELCTIKANQIVQRPMTDIQTSNLIKHAATPTNIRKERIMNGVRLAGYNDSPVVKEFDLEINTEFEKVDGRILNAPMLQYERNVVKPRNGAWNSGSFKFSVGSDMKQWTIVCLDSYATQQQLDKFAIEIEKQARNKGMNVGPKSNPIYLRPTPQNVNDYFQKNKSYDIIFVVINGKDKFQYGLVKTVAELKVGVLTQCVQSFTLTKSFISNIVSNILLKVNTKLNGINHTLETFPNIPKNTLILGADVTHPAPQAKAIPSIATVTGLQDPKTLMPYKFYYRLQPPTQEVILDFGNVALNLLKDYHRSNNGLPVAIIYFRDGVSQGQYNDVLLCELVGLKQACARIGGEQYKPDITVIVVQKRHHTRMFPTRPTEDRNNNVPVGTVVDTKITHPHLVEFYMVSHESMKGTARPTKYTVIYDDRKFSNDDLQRLTFDLCHMFPRCNRSVSYPAPTYLAHLACERAKVYVLRQALDMDNLKKEERKYQIVSEFHNGNPMFFD